MITAGSSAFVDTNVLVYHTFHHFAQHEVARRQLAECEKRRVALWTSRQVLREFLAVTTRPGFLTPLPPIPFVIQMVKAFEGRFQIAEDDVEVTKHLLELIQDPGVRGKQVHDANIVATMRRHKIGYLVTNNPADFCRHALWVTVVPSIP